MGLMWWSSCDKFVRVVKEDARGWAGMDVVDRRLLEAMMHLTPRHKQIGANVNVGVIERAGQRTGLSPHLQMCLIA